MRLIKKLLKIAGKESFKPDERIGIWYIIRMVRKYGLMMIRGSLISLTAKGINRQIFVGKHVSLVERKKIKIGCKTKIHDYVQIDALSENGVSIGYNCVIGEGTSIICTGSLASIGVGIKIGNRTTFGQNCFFGAAGGIIVGNDVIAGQNIRFHSENHNYKDLNLLIREQGVSHKGIVIGNNCWIGSGAVFLDGSKVGNGCVVAANAVVTKEFKDNVVIGGIPAKIIRKR